MKWEPIIPYANNKIIFKGVGSDKIVLKQYKGDNYNGLIYKDLNYKSTLLNVGCFIFNKFIC